MNQIRNGGSFSAQIHSLSSDDRSLTRRALFLHLRFLQGLYLTLTSSASDYLNVAKRRRGCSEVSKFGRVLVIFVLFCLFFGLWKTEDLKMKLLNQWFGSVWLKFLLCVIAVSLYQFVI